MRAWLGEIEVKSNLCLLLAVSIAALSTDAEMLFNREGIEFHGSLKVLIEDAAICRVSEDNLDMAEYETLRENEGASLQLWEVELYAENGSGKSLADVRASVLIVAARPPCTSWDPTEAYVEWQGSASHSRVPLIGDNFVGVERSSKDVPSDQVLSRKVHVLTLESEKVLFDFPALSYRIGSTQTTHSDEQHTLRIESESHRLEPLCSSVDQKPCWSVLSNWTDCHVWISTELPEIAVWFFGEGECFDGRLNGTGKLVLRYQGEGSMFGEGQYVDGFKQGDWIENWLKTEERGHYDHGLRTGVWTGKDNVAHWTTAFEQGMKQGVEVIDYNDGTRIESSYESGERHGREIRTYPNGSRRETPYVQGRRHGTAIVVSAEGSRTETPYMAGKREGVEVYVNDSAPQSHSILRRETSFADNRRHGAEVIDYRDGTRVENKYEKGNKHGLEIKTYSNGTRSETPYVQGKRHGVKVVASADGSRQETPFKHDKKEGIEIYVNDGAAQRHGLLRRETTFADNRMHGAEIIDYRDGSRVETTYENGLKHGMEERRYPNGSRSETPYVKGRRHGLKILTTADGSRTETPFKNDTKDGVEIYMNNAASKPHSLLKRETSFAENKKNGLETMTYRDGSHVETPFVEGEKHGLQVRTNSSGKKIEIRYVHGQQQD